MSLDAKFIATVSWRIEHAKKYFAASAKIITIFCNRKDVSYA